MIYQMASASSAATNQSAYTSIILFVRTPKTIDYDLSLLQSRTGNQLGNAFCRGLDCPGSWA
jgi:hypothetical protein